MDSSVFIEKCRFCGGRVIAVRKTKKSCFLGQFKNSGKEKRCSQCGQFLKKKDIVSVAPDEVLGWAKA